MEHKLYKVKGNNDGMFGRFRFTDGVSQWLNRRDADHAIAAGVAVRCSGDTAPYFAIMDVEDEASRIPLPENYAVSNTWEKPKGTLRKSNECQVYLEKKSAAIAQESAPPKGKKKSDASGSST